jgi:hypothetical protein
LRVCAICVEVGDVIARLTAAGMAAGALAVAALPAVAGAVPPANDNYLSSIPVNRFGTVLTTQEVTDSRDTTEATVQADLFSPPQSGGGAEGTLCNGVPFGRTVWYDFHPDIPGTAELQTAGFDAAVSVYEFDRTTSRLTKLIGCGNDPGVTEDVFAPVLGGKSYTVQIGGVDAGTGPAGGNLQFTFQFFGDRDQDGIFDPLDHCKTIAGTRAAGGCPPDIKSTVKLTAQPSGSGIVVRSLTVNARKGSHASLRCRKGCSVRQGRNARAHAAKTVSFSKLRGRFLPAGASIEIRVTKSGYFGDYIRFDIKPGNFKRIDRCLKPGSRTPRKHCP